MSSARAVHSLPFTGERVVPGAVEPDLWNEHISRYRFAALFAAQRQVLDLGCGTGYGADLLALSGIRTIALDSSDEAIAFASGRYSNPVFLTASVTELPFAKATFGLATAFEVIEHLSEWPLLLEEAARVLTLDGVFLVSTPNRVAYSEARGRGGPNPFHVHEFDLEEFQRALTRHFSFVRVLSQNHQPAIVFSSDQPGAAAAFLSPAPASTESHFFLAVCAHSPVNIPSFVFLPESANVLREREKHIRLLHARVGDLEGDLTSLMQAHREVQSELDEHNTWALGLDKDLLRAREQLNQQEEELAAAAAWIETMQAASRAERVAFQSQLEATQASLGAVEEARLGFEVRLQAAQRHNDNLVGAADRVQNSTWIRLGRVLHIGPGSNRHFRFSHLSAAARQYHSRALSFLKNTALYLAAPFLLLASAAALLALDLVFVLFGKRRLPIDSAPRHQSASIVIPTWNGRDLLARFLPSLLNAVDLDGGNEIIVVDNGSTDGSPDFILQQFPKVRLLKLAENRGFAGAANAGVSAAGNEVVVLLNNDMRVCPGFLEPLLRPFSDPHLFAVSSQIFFSDSERRREETGLTETWWNQGFLGVGHRVDPEIEAAYPCAYPGGGSSAFDRSKFLELGGFDALFHPFYYEDTDLGRLAWKRGWKVLYEPASVVFHEHRATIGKHFSSDHIQAVLRKNAIVYCWKNIHDWRLLGSHFRACLSSSLSTRLSNPARSCSPSDAWRVFRQLPRALNSRFRALSTSAISDDEAFKRPLGGYFYDRFEAASVPVPARLNILFLSPYPIEPPTHGGAVFMKETLKPLSAFADIHILSFVDTSEQLAAQEPLSALCKTLQLTVRPHFPLEAVWTLTPCAIQEFGVRDFAWRIHRTIYLQRIDALQIEYTILGQYAGAFRNIPCFLFEHDISVQSLWRRLATSHFDLNLFLEYLRMRLYEPRMLKRFRRIQVCSVENAGYLLRLLPSLRGRVDSDVRAAIDTRRYAFISASRIPDTLLFLGSFRHSPNLDALRWFTQEVFPAIVRARPSVVLHIVGSDPPQSSTIWNDDPNIRLLGSVPDIRDPLQRFAVFICPVISGSGVRVKLLEAFASGIPAVSTIVGAEGLAQVPGEYCELADSAETFAASVLRLLSNPDESLAMARRARRMVEQERDSLSATIRLESFYRLEALQTRTGCAMPMDTPAAKAMNSVI